MRTSKHPHKAAILHALERDQAALKRWQTIHEERMFQVSEALEHEAEARAEIACLLAAIDDHWDALKDVERSDRLLRRIGA